MRIYASQTRIMAKMTARPHQPVRPPVGVTCRHVFPASDVMNMLTLLLDNSAPIEPVGKKRGSAITGVFTRHKTRKTQKPLYLISE